VLGRLAEAYLVTEDASGRFGMHDLLRLFARGACQDTDSRPDREAAELRLVGYYADLARFVNSCVDPNLRPAAAQEAVEAGVTLPSMREALAIVQAERRSLLAAVGLAAQRGWYEQVGRLSERMRESLTVLRYLDDLLTVTEAALAAARRTADTRAEGRALNNLGLAYQELRQLEKAITSYQQALAIFRETGERRSEGRILNNLGMAYQALRRFEEAIDCYEQDIAICRETGDRYGEGQTLANLGNAYQVMGQRDRAVMSWREAAAAMRDAGDHEEAGRLEQLAADVRARRRRWWRRGNRTAGI
jgi:tetratricopeptide (TPR) repeat protein